MTIFVLCHIILSFKVCSCVNFYFVWCYYFVWCSILLYVNDIHLASDKFNAILYADDTTLVGPLCSFKYDRKSNDYNNISNHINAELNEICKWLSSNKLFLNAPKTKYMLFHLTCDFPQRRITDIDLTLKINDLHIDRVHEFNFLGTIIHETLEWTRTLTKWQTKYHELLGY